MISLASYSRWDGGPGGLADVNPVRTPPLVGRREYITAAVEAIRGGSTGAVLLVAEAGLGKSVLIEAIASALSSEMIVMRVHGTASLSSVPYGVLAPYLVDLPEDPTNSQVAILRAFWAQFERLRAGRDLPLLLVVDDAHELDPATANVIVDLITANWARVVASSRPRPGLPEAMMQLWYDSMAERFDLEPLDRENVGTIAEHILGGPLVPGAIQMLWKASEGNPMLLNCLIEDARREGNLAKKDGVWLLLRPLSSSGPALTGVVRNQLLRRTPQEREALTMIALAEPVSLDALEATAGPDMVQDLVESQLVSVDNDERPSLRLRHPVYGEAIRNMVSASRSLQLRQRLLTNLQDKPQTPASMLRMVNWALESGVSVPDGQLLLAAIHAATTFQNTTAIGLAARIRDTRLRRRGRAAAARAHFNGGQYVEADRSLEAGLGGNKSDVGSLRVGDTLLHACIMNALARQRSTAAPVPEDGNRGGGQEADPAADGDSNTVTTLLALQAAGNYSALAEALDRVDSIARPDTSLAPAADDAAEEDYGAQLAVFADCLRSDTLRAQGDPVAAQLPADRAAASLADDPAELFFFPEYILQRRVWAALDAGNWKLAADILDKYEATAGSGLLTFGGTVDFYRGISLLRQGRFDSAWATVRPAVESLRVNDPLQLLPAAVGLAAYAGARCGEGVKAQALLEESERTLWRGRGAEAAYAGILAAAARETLTRDGVGLERLRELLAEAQPAGVELQGLAAWLELGRPDAAPRTLELTGTMTGSWAQAWNHYATARSSGEASVSLEMGDAIYSLGMARLARDCYSQAAGLFEASGEKLNARQAVIRRDQAERELGEQTGMVAEPAASPANLLTRRERDIIALAVEGLTDRQIADRLMVSVRTVEGHLYRSYAKLGIRRREELRGAAGL
ncbi:AAA family ATPase [Arthrobacter sp. M4]|uniref:AAA family ATPase n=1 Tax=Arthrobacter sp. M4 TaxID=218160 RepID=UPI001CDBB8EB|nr:LuxR family transcriptional regulator [Arthrobacter sp. M4]MCA4133600.1 LuxR family transcriptional regulator [Arthrobacter sp. M4]